MTFQPDVLVIGDSSPVEFQHVLSDLDRRAVRSTLELLPAADSMPERLSEVKVEPTLVFLAQNRPGEWTSPRVEAVHRRWPAARLVMLLGSWCEGELRTGRPVPGVARTYWHQWAAHAGRYWEQRGAGEHPWNLPRTSTSVEQLQLVANVAMGQRDKSRLVAIDAVDTRAYDALAESLFRDGHQVARWRTDAGGEVRGADVLIWDDPGRSRTDWGRLRACRESSVGIPLIAIGGMVRWDDWLAAREWGVELVLAKPFDLADLLWAVRAAGRSEKESPPRTAPAARNALSHLD